MASHSSNVQVSKVLMMLVSVLWFCNKYMIYPHHLTGIHHTLFIVSKASPPLLHHHLLPSRLIRGRHIASSNAWHDCRGHDGVKFCHGGS